MTIGWKSTKLIGRRVPMEKSTFDENSWMKTPTSQDKKQPIVAVFPRQSKDEMQKLTMGDQHCQKENSQQELTYLVSEKEVPEAWTSRFMQEVSFFDHVGVDEQH